MQLYQTILAEEAELTQQQEHPPSPMAQTLLAEVAGDDVLTEAALAWVRAKKRELLLAQLITLRGQDWVDEHLQGITEGTGQ